MMKTRHDSTEYELETQIGFQLRLAHQKNTAIFTELIPDLTPTQWAAVSQLHRAKECSQNHLGRMTGMDTSTIKGVVGRLESRSLIEVIPHESDRRRVLIRLTEIGEATYQQHLEAAFEANVRIGVALRQTERDQLYRLLKKLNAFDPESNGE